METFVNIEDYIENLPDDAKAKLMVMAAIKGVDPVDVIREILDDIIREREAMLKS